MFKIAIEGRAYYADNWADAMLLCNKIKLPAVVYDHDGDFCSVHNMTEETALEDADMSVRAYNILKRAGCNTLGDAIRNYDLPNLRNCGKKTMQEIRNYAIALRTPLWSDKQGLMDLALFGLQVLADRKGVDIDDDEDYQDFCRCLTENASNGWGYSVDSSAGEVIAIKEKLEL